MRLFGYPYNDLVICKDSPDYLRVMIILRLLLLLTNLHLKLLSTQGTGADKLLSTQRVNVILDNHLTSIAVVTC